MGDYSDILDAPSTTEHKGYAGFWLRLAAYIVDAIIVGVVQYGIGFIMLGGSFMAMSAEDMEGGMPPGMALWYLLSIAIQWVYFAYQESSPTQATIGKKLVGIKVTDMNGERISFLNATGRHFAKIISAVILLIGFLMVAFTEKRQGLHDILAKTLVVKS